MAVRRLGDQQSAQARACGISERRGLVVGATKSTYEVLAIRMGTRDSTKRDVYLNFGLYGIQDEPIPVEYYFWVIRNAERTVIVDTGFSEDGGAKRDREMLIHPREALRLLGIDPSQIHALVLTHGHYDHIGNADLFERVPIYMAQSEYEFWTSPMARRRQFAYYSEEREIAVLEQARADGRLHLFRDDCDLFPGIRLSRVGGHTAGQSIAYADSADGTVLLASDAVHFYEELEKDMPFTVASDVPGMLEAFDRIRDEQNKTFTHLVAGHDKAVLERYPACNLLPEGLAAIISGASLA